MLWQRPSNIVDSYATERRVGSLELFYDLVFVVVVSQLAQHLAEHTRWSTYGWFLLLLTVMFSAWLQGSFYVDAHGTEDLSIRVFTFAQMIALAITAVYIGATPGDGSHEPPLTPAGSAARTSGAPAAPVVGTRQSSR